MFNGKNLPHELSLTTRQTIKLRNAIENKISTDIKLSKTQMCKIIQSREFLGLLLSKIARSIFFILAPLGITAAFPAIDAGIQKKIHGSRTTTLIISNEETNDISKIVQALGDSNILLKGITKTIKNQTKEQIGGFLGILLGPLGTSLLGHILTEKGLLRVGYGFKDL